MCRKSLNHKQCVNHVAWSVEQNRGTNIVSVDTGAVLLDLENLDTEEVQKIINPQGT